MFGIFVFSVTFVIWLIVLGIFLGWKIKAVTNDEKYTGAVCGFFIYSVILAMIATIFVISGASLQKDFGMLNGPPKTEHTNPH